MSGARYSGGAFGTSLLAVAGTAWAGYQVRHVPKWNLNLNQEYKKRLCPSEAHCYCFQKSWHWWIVRLEKPIPRSTTGPMEASSNTTSGTGRHHYSCTLYILLQIDLESAANCHPVSTMLINDICSWREKEGQLCRTDSDCNWLHDKLTVPDSIRDQCQIQQTINVFVPCICV